MHGMHTYFANNLNYNTLKNSKNIIGGYDQINNDAYLIVNYDQINNDAYLVINDDFAICYNELTNSFTSFCNIDEATLLLKNANRILFE